MLLTLFQFAMFVVAVALVLLVLIQRGKGGGLAGAFGGQGGSSGFGVKAGDSFMKATMVAAGLWILLCIGTILQLNARDNVVSVGDGKTGVTAAGDGKDDSDGSSSKKGGESDDGS
ncbi:MAG: preprotein translocase subunit SecG [Planctomycetales bacterium]